MLGTFGWQMPPPIALTRYPRLVARRSEFIQRAVANLPAPSFSFVMASGIVSVSLLMHGLEVFSWILLGVGAVGYVLLIVLTIAQVRRHPGEVRGHLQNPQTRFGYFTFVAASGVLGSRLILADVTVIPLIQLGVAVFAWPWIAWVVLRAMRADPRPWRNEVNGSWFLLSVAANSIGVLSGGLADLHPQYTDVFAVVSISAWTIGLICYLTILYGVGSRVVGKQLTAESLTAPYWITMGACAITVLNSSRIANLPVAAPLTGLTDEIGRIGLVIWFFATLLIPVILVVGWWRHMHRHIPFDSTVMLWSIVFPIGMYDVASTLMAQDHDLPVAQVIGSAGVWLALAAWVLTIASHFWRRTRPPDSA